MTVAEQMLQLATQAKAASHQLALLSTQDKNHCLESMAEAILTHSNELQLANQKDLATATEMGLSQAMLDRLTLTNTRIQAMAQGLREVAALPDPVGRTLDERTRPNGLRLQKVSVPIGVVVIIYESRPNVTADAASLCLKSGNATILRGGKEALHSNQLIAKIMVDAAQKNLPQFPEYAIQVVPTTDRAAIPELLSLTHLVDLCMPRGGEGLIRAVADCSKVPVIKHYKGVCHTYLDRHADPNMAESVAVNAKTQRPGVCNAMETLLVDAAAAKTLLPIVAKSLAQHHVELRADPESLEILQSTKSLDTSSLNLKPATDQDYHTEYNDLILNVRTVKGVDSAIHHINRYGSHHSDCIITAHEPTARKFLAAVDSAAVYWNASTRFTDGNQFGMGAEIGISTDKVGARGPMGLEELTTIKWLCFGSGQIRT
jgi:glutamate-5-semialdehyde dehydrogenase